VKEEEIRGAIAVLEKAYERAVERLSAP
jgi:hypothetical protein